MTKIKEFAESIHVWITILISVGAMSAAVGITISPPWARADDVLELRKQVTDLITKQKNTDTLSLKTQRLVLQGQLRDAKEDLRKNPNSYSAQELVRQLEEQLEEINRELRNREK